MQNDAALINDIYEAVKVYIQKADLQHIADDLVRIFDDHGYDGFIDEPTLNGKLRIAVKHHFQLEEELEFDDEGAWDDD